MKTFLLAMLSLVLLPAAFACDDADKIYKVCSDPLARYRHDEAAAKKDKKLLVVVLGAEWCPWCMSLHKMLHDPAVVGDITKSYDLSDVAMYEGKKKLPGGLSVLKHLQKRAHDFDKKKVEGIPVLAVVNPVNGKAAIIGTEPLEQNTKEHKGHDPKKVLAALDAARAQVQ